VLVDGGTTGASALRIETLAAGRSLGATVLLVKQLNWDDPQCISYRFDLMAPVRADAGGRFIVGGISMFGSERGVSLLLDTTDPTGVTFSFGARRAADASGADAAPSDDVVDLVGTVSKSPGTWFRATITLLRNASGGYDTRASLVAAGTTSNAEQFNYVFPPQPELQKQANVFVGAFHETPIEAKVLIDSVRVTTGNPSSTAKGDQ
jgi:hypothetical protein